MMQKSSADSSSRRMDASGAAEKLLVNKDDIQEWLRKGLLKGSVAEIQQYELEKFRAKYPSEIARAQKHRSESKAVAENVSGTLTKPEEQAKSAKVRAKSPSLFQRIGGFLSSVFGGRKKKSAAATNEPKKNEADWAPLEKTEKVDKFSIDYEARFQEPKTAAAPAKGKGTSTSGLPEDMELAEPPTSLMVPPKAPPDTESAAVTRIHNISDILGQQANKTPEKSADLNPLFAPADTGRTLDLDVGDLFRGGKGLVALADMSGKVDQLTKSLQAETDRASAAEQQIARLHEELDSLRSQSRTSHASGEQASAVNNELQSLRANFQQAQQHIQAQQARVLDFQKQLQRAETILRNKDLEIAQLNQEINSLQARYSSQERLILQTQPGGGDANQHAELARMLEEARNQLNAKTFEYERLKSQHALFEQDHGKIVSALEQDVARLTAVASGRLPADVDMNALQEVQKRYKDLEAHFLAQKQRWEKELGSASSWVAKLTETVKDRDKKILELQALLKAANPNEVSNLQQELRRTQERGQQAVLEIRKRDAEISDLKARLGPSGAPSNPAAPAPRPGIGMSLGAPLNPATKPMDTGVPPASLRLQIPSAPDKSGDGGEPPARRLGLNVPRTRSESGESAGPLGQPLSNEPS